MNDDTNGHNKAITGGGGNALLKRQASCVGPVVSLHPSHRVPVISAHLCSRADVLEKAVSIF